MLTIKEIEKLSEEKLKQVCDVSYTKDNKGKDFKIITYPKKENYHMSEEQMQNIAEFIYHNVGDVRKYTEEHQEDYKKWLEEENKKNR